MTKIPHLTFTCFFNCVTMPLKVIRKRGIAMEKLSRLTAPALAGVVREKSCNEAIAEIMNCVYGGADMIDLHLSMLGDREKVKEVIAASKLPVLALNYNITYEGDSSGFDEEARIQTMLDAVEAGAAGIDMQGYSFHLPSKTAFCGEDKYSFTKGNPREIVTDNTIISKQCQTIEKVHEMGAEVLLSCHPGIAMDSRQVVDLALFMEKRKPDIIKIVTVANSDDEMIESFKAMTILKREVKTPVSYHASGKSGLLSRIVNPILGGQIIFCVDRYSVSSTKEQLDLRTVRAIIDGIKKIK